jgi:phosphoenolpyruvate---glycerone phosphotransferase subunit DhaL
MAGEIGTAAIAEAMRRVAKGLATHEGKLTELDQALGDGDLGITAVKIGETLETAAGQEGEADLGKRFGQLGMAINRVASSTMGTLMATALMRGGQAVAGKQALAEEDLPRMFAAAVAGMQARGKAQLGDKTIIDALHPASEALAAALASGKPLAEAAAAMAAAAREGADRVTPLRNKIGRASWQNERSEGKPDAGCAFAVVVLEALAGVA